MSKFYSSSTGGFYAREIHGDAMPADAVEISDAAHAALMAAQAQGKRILPDANGFPVAVDLPSAGIPSAVSPRQARLALKQAGHLDSVKAVVAAADESTQIAWEYATSIERTSPIVTALATALGLADADLDSLFSLAATL